MMTSKAALGQKLRARRELLRLTQQEVADAISIGRVGYTLYESGKNAVAATDLPLLAKVLKVPVSYFFEEDEMYSVAEDPAPYNTDATTAVTRLAGDVDRRLTGIEEQLQELLERIKQNEK